MCSFGWQVLRSFRRVAINSTFKPECKVSKISPDPLRSDGAQLFFIFAIFLTLGCDRELIMSFLNSM